MHLGIDLGTSNVVVANRSRGVLFRCPSLVAVERNTGRILATAEAAAKMLAQPAANVVPLRPLKDGAVASQEAADALLQDVLKRANRMRVMRPTVAISVTAEATSVERRAVVEAAQRAGARRVEPVPRPLAAGLGAGLPVQEAEGRMVVDLGGGATDVGVLSMTSVVVAGTSRVGGNRMDEAIRRMLRRVHNAMIGEATAESLKLQLSSVYPQDSGKTMEVNGQDLIDGLPRTITVQEREVREALEEPLSEIVTCIRAVLEKTPPELSADLAANGILLTGGAAQLAGLDQLLQRLLGVRVRVAEHPADAVALGACRLAPVGAAG